MRPVLLAALTLPLGFLAAELSGVRAIGGAVLVTLGLVTLALARPGIGRGAAWAAVAFVAFAGSHLLAEVLGTWGAVLLAGLVTGAAGAVLLTRSGATSR